MIKSLRLRNFKCFEDCTIPLSYLTLLTGLNGMGKSTVIQALLLLRQSYQQNMLPNVGLALNGPLVHIGTGKDALFEGTDVEQIEFVLETETDQSLHWQFGYESSADVMEIVSSPVTPDAAFSGLFTDDFHYLQAERIGPRTTYSKADYEVRQHRQLGISGEYTSHFLSAFGKESIANPNLKHGAANSDNLKDQVEAWLGEVSPGTRLHLVERPGTDLISLQYSFETGKQTSNEYRPTNVGFGITYIISVLTALLSASPGSLLLLENPEAHLHPRGQIRIGKMLSCAAEAGVQIVVESHSDHIFNGIRLGVHDSQIKADQIKIHYFTRHEHDDHVFSDFNSPTIDPDGRIEHWPDGFFDEFDKALMSLLRPKATQT